MPHTAEREHLIFRTDRRYFGKVVKWQDPPSALWNCGAVEASSFDHLRIYVFNKHSYGKSRAVKRVDRVLFT